MSDKKLLHDALLSIKNDLDNSKVPSTGICQQVEFYLVINPVWSRDSINTIELLNYLFLSWSEFSGDDEYPIPHKKERPSTTYCTCDLWVMDTEYGQARFRCLDWLIEQTKGD